MYDVVMVGGTCVRIWSIFFQVSSVFAYLVRTAPSWASQIARLSISR